ncbi:hypothetical protein GAG18_12190 [Salmonella enterica]|nr:hypothetical protein [Salmonella enterica]EBH9977620.1 hypothetical protein [Salmonella enterica subsp. arizonae serovar 40:z36:-]EBA5085623.1 hypothetical protein [Salmonella enterica]EDC3687464.1 hypothetical protein [Salmonella enterica]EDZ1187155.1 hypothetical protein [Salmonella enterica]
MLDTLQDVTTLTSTGNLSNAATTNPAGNVEIQLLDKNDKPKDLNDTNDRYFACDAVGEELQCIIKVQYYSLGNATAGAVSSVITYTTAYK